jgi:hypothetical protein
MPGTNSKHSLLTRVVGKKKDLKNRSKNFAYKNPGCQGVPDKTDTRCRPKTLTKPICLYLPYLFVFDQTHRLILSTTQLSVPNPGAMRAENTCPNTRQHASSNTRASVAKAVALSSDAEASQHPRRSFRILRTSFLPVKGAERSGRATATSARAVALSPRDVRAFNRSRTKLRHATKTFEKYEDALQILANCAVMVSGNEKTQHLKSFEKKYFENPKNTVGKKKP